MNDQNEMMGMKLSFGSGDIYAAIATDVVALAGHSVTMTDSLLLMMDHQLDVELENFQGIFGLGPPVTNDIISKNWILGAGIYRFSMCLNSLEDNSNGVFRISPAVQPVVLPHLGKYHWGLDFQGISVGATTNPVAFCNPAQKGPNMDTACGIIPDSGSTLILGPSFQVRALYAELCDRWSRCSAAYQKAKATGQFESPRIDAIRKTLSKWGFPKAITRPLGLDPATQEQMHKKQTFEALLSNCGQWGSAQAAQGESVFADFMDSELPELNFHVAGATGVQQTLRMPGSGYSVATKLDDLIVCFPFIGEIDYITEKNGPIWVFGTPLFYEYEVHFDMAGEGSISFSQSPTGCGSCAPSPLGFTEVPGAGPAVGLMKRKSGMIGELDVKVRMPKINTSLPL